MGINGRRQTDTDIYIYGHKWSQANRWSKISIYGHKVDADRQIQISPYMGINVHRQTDGQNGSYLKGHYLRHKMDADRQISPYMGIKWTQNYICSDLHIWT